MTLQNPFVELQSETDRMKVSKPQVRPRLIGVSVAWIGFGLASLASLGFLVWFVASENNSPGLSFTAALIVMPLLVTLFGFFKITPNGIAKDGKSAGWAAIVIALPGVGYIAAFFGSWLIISCLWLTLHIPMIIGIVSSPTSEK
jgi:hypothetical protein